MPFPTLAWIAFGVGITAALLGGSELRLSPRHALLTSTFRAYALFLCLVLLPVSVYFYLFHGDWFLLYSVDVRRIPSAVALVGFVLEGGLGAIGFLLGAALARNQRPGVGYLMIGVSALAVAALVVLCRDRLAVVGTFAQYNGDFGLRAYGGALLQGGFALGLLLLYAAAYLLIRIHLACRRGGS